MKSDVAPDLHFFVLLAKLGSMSATARELGVTPPAVTKRLSLLEQRLGVRLVNRTTRRISLTSEGERYLAQASAILGSIRDGRLLSTACLPVRDCRNQLPDEQWA